MNGFLVHLKQISFVTNVPDTSGLWVEIEITAEKKSLEVRANWAQTFAVKTVRAIVWM